MGVPSVSASRMRFMRSPSQSGHDRPLANEGFSLRLPAAMLRGVAVRLEVLVATVAGVLLWTINSTTSTPVGAVVGRRHRPIGSCRAGCGHERVNAAAVIVEALGG